VLARGTTPKLQKFRNYRKQKSPDKTAVTEGDGLKSQDAAAKPGKSFKMVAAEILTKA
jgi:hypothetical protein